MKEGSEFNMKVILSRKGFDSENGKAPSPIMPDGTLLSMPIPSNDNDRYEDLAYNGHTYKEILSDLKPDIDYSTCHLDPDLSLELRKKRPKYWSPAYGQINQSQNYLKDTAHVDAGDLFLFFGSFHRVKEIGGRFRYVRNSGDFFSDNDIHIVFGYMQIGRIISDSKEAAKYEWHPHSYPERRANPTNTIYVPTETLSFRHNMPGSGLFTYADKRILTLNGCTKATWKENAVYMPDAIIGTRKNSAKGPGVYYSGIWQELALQETKDAEKWAKSLF